MVMIHTYFDIPVSFFLKARRDYCTLSDKYSYITNLLSFIANDEKLFKKYDACKKQLAAIESYEEFVLTLTLLDDESKEFMMLIALSIYNTFMYLHRMIQENGKNLVNSYANDKYFDKLVEFIHLQDLHSPTAGLF